MHWTLCVEDVEQLTLAAQDLLLRFLDVTSAPDPLRTVDRDRPTVRLITTTTKDLYACAGHEAFRWNLFYRLNVIHLIVPPSRDCHDDRTSVTEYLLGETARIEGARQLTAHDLNEGVASDWSSDSGDLQSLLASFCVPASGESSPHPPQAQ